MSHDHTTTERWRSVVGYEGFYDVSDHARIRSLMGNYGHVRSVPLILKVDPGPKGHQRVVLSKNRQATRYLGYRLMLLAFVGPCPAGMEACHADDDPSNNRLNNLRWDTRSENAKEAYRNGRQTSKLSPEDCARARDLLDAGHSRRAVGRALGVAGPSIGKAIRVGRI